MTNANEEMRDDELGPDPDGVMLEIGVAGIAEAGATGGVGLLEVALPEEDGLDDMERRELLVNPSDLQDVGDPEAGDVGVVGGLAAGAEMGLSGRDHEETDPWGLDLIDGPDEINPAGVGGTGVIESEMAEAEAARLAFEEEKL
jgi:hypothetical protein